MREESKSSNSTTIDFAGQVKVVRPKSKKSVANHNQTHSKEESKRIDSSASQNDDVEAPRQRAEAEVPRVTVVSDLSIYQGDTLEERVNDFILAHPVVMITKTWCLFSKDAQSFLVEEMKVSIHVVEVDSHPNGKAILKHVQSKTRHKTVPVIYVKGEFLGGFEDGNRLYASGELQNNYLSNLTQADQCEEFLVKSNFETKPLFWFPENINAHVVMMTAIIISLSSALSVGLVLRQGAIGRYICYGLFFDFVLRLLGGARISVIGRIAIFITLLLEPKRRHGRPKQFATFCGVIISGLASFFYLLDIFPAHDYVAVGLMGCLAIFAGMEGFLDFCVGCVIFKYGIQLGLIKK